MYNQHTVCKADYKTLSQLFDFQKVGQCGTVGNLISFYLFFLLIKFVFLWVVLSLFHHGWLVTLTKQS